MTIVTNILLASIPFLVNFYANRFQEHDKEYAFDEAPSDLGLPREERYDFIIGKIMFSTCPVQILATFFRWY